MYTGHRLIDAVPDRDGTLRRAIVFELAPVTSAPNTDASPGPERYKDQLPPIDILEAHLWASNQKRVAENENTYVRAEGVPSLEGSRTSRATRTFVLRRARGHCEGCGAPAPFRRLDGSPYLEPVPIHLGSDQELGGPEGVIALCPNCHRRAHFANDGTRYNDALITRLEGRQP